MMRSASDDPISIFATLDRFVAFFSGLHAVWKRIFEWAPLEAGRLVDSAGWNDLESVPLRLEEDEIIEVVPMSFAAALDLVWQGEIPDPKSALALIYAARLLGQI